jgi:uncharacterized protein YgiB involved in biofilm formation
MRGNMNTKQVMNLAAAANAASTYCLIDADETVAQIGRMNVLAISGGRVFASDTAVVMPVSSGYHVVISLDPSDTYTVQRVFVRNGRAYVKGEWTDVYCDQIGEAAYQASCYLDPVAS